MPNRRDKTLNRIVKYFAAIVPLPVPPHGLRIAKFRMVVVSPTCHLLGELFRRPKAIVIDAKPCSEERLVLIEPRMSHGLAEFIDENPRFAQKKLMWTVRPNDTRRIDDGLILAIFFAIVSQAHPKSSGLKRWSLG